MSKRGVVGARSLRRSAGTPVSACPILRERSSRALRSHAAQLDLARRASRQSSASSRAVAGYQSRQHRRRWRWAASGKTPVVAHLASGSHAAGKAPAILTRGYRRETEPQR